MFTADRLDGAHKRRSPFWALHDNRDAVLAVFEVSRAMRSLTYVN